MINTEQLIIKHSQFMKDLKINNPDLNIQERLSYTDLLIQAIQDDPGTSDSVRIDGVSEKFYQHDVILGMNNVRVENDIIYFDTIFKIYNDSHKYKAICYIIDYTDYEFTHIEDDGSLYKIKKTKYSGYDFEIFYPVVKTNETYY